MVRGTAAFAAASIVQRSVGFLLLPLYARILTPGEYGQIGVITGVTAALGTVLGLGLETAIFRARIRYVAAPGAAHAFVNTVGGFALAVPIFVGSVLSVVAVPAAAEAFDVPVDALRAALIGTALSVSATLVPLAVLRSQERLGDYVRLTGIQVVLTMGLTLLLVAVMRWGVTGWMLANALSSFLLLSRGLIVLNHRWSMTFDIRYLRQALAFGLPLVPHALSHWGLSLSDRVVLGVFVDPAQVGHYYVAYQFGLPISVLAISLAQGVQPLYAQAADSSDRRIEIAQISTHQVLVIAFVAAVIAVVGPAAVVVALPVGYAEATQFIPWIALGVCLFGLYLIPVNAVTVMAGRTRWLWAVSGIAALANIGLNLAFVPRFGPLAAAINTAVGYAILLGGVFLYMRRVCDPPIPYEWRRIGLGLALIASVSTSAMIIAPSEPIIAVVVRSAVMLLVPILLVATGMWRGLAQGTERTGRSFRHWMFRR